MSLRPENARGTERLLHDCALVGRMLDRDRPSARRRLERRLGRELLGRLLRSAQPPAEMSRERRRRA
jgi:hypothetical protein